jgi:asparagine synthase (glutamine-hydrolysing)
MCGICGIYNFGNGKPVDSTVLNKMTDVLIHRGPDDEGFYISDFIGLGHRRLRIVDIESGHQPIFNEDESICIVFNGEIYNFIELRDLMIKKGHIFKTNSDTEVIVHLYEEVGEDCVTMLRGMFAFAIWDEKQQKLLLARDRLGKKPLYYSLNDTKFIFGSEIKSILQYPGFPREIDLEALSDYFSFLYIPGPKTIFKEIKKLLPGHYFVCTPQRIQEKRYWDIEFVNSYSGSETFFERKLRELFEEAVKIRLISDVPLGAFLSGGIDSSSVVAIMANIIYKPVITTSIGFEEEKFNELSYAKIIADRFKTKHYEYVVKPDAVRILEKLAWYFDEPFADSSAVPTYYLSKVSREKITVALSGDGGDENFAGYRRYYYDRLENQLRSFFPVSFRRYFIGGIGWLYPKADWLPQVLRAKTLLTNLSLSPLEGYFNTMSAFTSAMKNKLFSYEVRKLLKGYNSLSVFENYFNKANTDDPLSRIQYLDIKTYLVDDILTKVDRASMANSLEVRSPLLDHELVEFVASIPSHLKLKGREGKYIFKQSLNEILPEDIFKRKKMGFSIPLDRWFRVELKNFTEDILFSRSERGYFNKSFIEKLWQDHQRGLGSYGTHLWALLMFEIWHRNFVD